MIGDFYFGLEDYYKAINFYEQAVKSGNEFAKFKLAHSYSLIEENDMAIKLYKEFITKYVIKDDDGDTILHKTPCTFLGNDNKCTIYNVRPFACKDYPHTNRKKMNQILDLTVKNTEICPAVVRILENIEDTLT